MVLRTKSKETKIIEYAQKLQPNMPYDDIVEYINRQVQWNIIFAYAHHSKVKRVKCEICEHDGVTKVWCVPCVHQKWCCECCIALGIPNYSAGIFILSNFRCKQCKEEFMDTRGYSHTRDSLGKKTIVKPKLIKCPKCGTIESLPLGKKEAS